MNWDPEDDMSALRLPFCCRYYRPAVYKVLEAHRRRQVATQASSIEEAQRTTAEVISEKMGPDGITVNVHSKVRTIFSMYKAVQSQISSKLAGKPMEDVPDEEVRTTVATCATMMCCLDHVATYAGLTVNIVVCSGVAVAKLVFMVCASRVCSVLIHEQCSMSAVCVTTGVQYCCTVHRCILACGRPVRLTEHWLCIRQAGEPDRRSFTHMFVSAFHQSAGVCACACVTHAPVPADTETDQVPSRSGHGL